jgi:hypothetical protein
MFLKSKYYFFRYKKEIIIKKYKNKLKIKLNKIK